MEYDYIKNAFTKANDKTNLEVNNLNLDCITSKNNKFELDSEGNLTVKSITAESGISSGGLGDSIDILNSVYPIGSIYLSVIESNPTTLFGGVWEQLKDTFLLGCGDFFANGSIGGEAYHQLSVAEMPSHCHTQQYNGYNSNPVWGIAPTLGDGSQMSGLVTLPEGGSQPHNNMPPYLTVYMWKRIQ